jgi:uncharacterized membrane protein
VGYGLLQLIVGASVLLVRPFGVLPVIIILCFFFAGFIWANYVVREKIGKRKEVLLLSDGRKRRRDKDLFRFNPL